MSNPVQSLDSIAPVGDSKKEAGPKDPVQADYEEGKKFFENGSLGQAAVALHNALLGYEEKNDRNGVANAANQLGHVCIARGEFDKALQYYDKSWKICEDLGDPMSLLAINRQYIIVYRGLEQYSKAVDICFDIIDLHQANNNPRGTVETMEILAEIYEEMGDVSKAADTYRTIASIHKNYKHDTIAESFLDKAAAIEG